MSAKPVQVQIAKAKDTNELIRMLAILRLQTDLEASAKGINEHVVLNLGDNELEALPESLIVQLIADYSTMKKNGANVESIIKSLEMQRTLQGHQAVNRNCATIQEYIKTRLHTEFPQHVNLHDKIIEMHTLYALYWFNKESKTAADWQKANEFAAKVIAAMQKTVSPTTAGRQAEDKKNNQNIEERKSALWPYFTVGIIALAAALFWLYSEGYLASFMTFATSYFAK